MQIDLRVSFTNDVSNIEIGPIYRYIINFIFHASANFSF